MGYLILQIILCIILAVILGFLIGWLLRIWPRKDQLCNLEEKLNRLETRIDSFSQDKGATGLDSKVEECLKKCSAFEDRFRKDLDIEGAEIAALKSRIEQLEKKPEQSVASTVKDDLRKISGIGKVLEKMLNSQGLTSFRQIAELSEAAVDSLDQFLNFPDRIRREKWREQARQLHFRKYKESIK